MRCTFECATPKSLWSSWLQAKEHFPVKLLNNKMKVAVDKVKQPPNMHVIVEFRSRLGYSLAAEIQIHLRAIHRLKEMEHVAYEIKRSNKAEELSKK